VAAKSGQQVDLIITDLGSGLNYQKVGFQRLSLLILQGQVKELILPTTIDG
jgi:predicted site-specific integrase-resolvase